MSTRRSKVDRISKLPDSLICQILDHLHIKEAVKTSVLSTRWRNQWLWAPNLELSSRKFPDFSAFVSFGDRFFDSSRVSCIQKLNLDIHENEDGVDDDDNDDDNDDDASYLTSWIDAATKRKVQHVHVRCPLREMPSSLYICETLVSLELSHVAFVNSNTEFVSLPCLKTMTLKHNWYQNETTLERLVSSCPVLEELVIEGLVNNHVKVFRLISRSLKRLTMRIIFLQRDIGSSSRVVIDAPRLCFLSIIDNLSDNFVINSMDSNAKVEISLSFGLNVFGEANVSSTTSSIRGFLSGVSKVRDMTIRGDTFEVICEYSKQEPLPRFGYMSRLQVVLRNYSYLNWLPTFLESFPNLKSFNLLCIDRGVEGMEDTSFWPECLLPSLEFVEIKLITLSDMMLVRYLLENSPILKTLTIRLIDCKSQLKDGSLVEKLHKIPRRSTKCEIVFLDWY